MSYLGIFWLEFENNIGHILKQHRRICLIAKFCKKSKRKNKFGTKNVLFGYFQKLLSYLKSAPLILSRNQSLTQTVNFRVGSAFSRGPGSAFSEGPSPGPGPLYKVYPLFLFF